MQACASSKVSGEGMLLWMSERRACWGGECRETRAEDQSGGQGVWRPYIVMICILRLYRRRAGSGKLPTGHGAWLSVGSPLATLRIPLSMRDGTAARGNRGGCASPLPQGRGAHGQRRDGSSSTCWKDRGCEGLAWNGRLVAGCWLRHIAPTTCVFMYGIDGPCDSVFSVEDWSQETVFNVGGDAIPCNATRPRSRGSAHLDASAWIVWNGFSVQRVEHCLCIHLIRYYRAGNDGADIAAFDRASLRLIGYVNLVALGRNAFRTLERNMKTCKTPREFEMMGFSLLYRSAANCGFVWRSPPPSFFVWSILLHKVRGRVGMRLNEFSGGTTEGRIFLIRNALGPFQLSSDVDGSYHARSRLDDGGTTRCSAMQIFSTMGKNGAP